MTTPFDIPSFIKRYLVAQIVFDCDLTAVQAFSVPYLEVEPDIDPVSRAIDMDDLFDCVPDYDSSEDIPF